MKRKKKEEYVKVCPRCGSTNITPFRKRYHLGGAEEFVDGCDNCKYEGFVPEVKESELKKI